MRTTAAIACTVLLLAHPSIAVAAMLHSDESIVITVPVTDDIYAVGRLISTTETVKGDLIAAGQMITVSGDITEDVSLAGASIDIAGTIGDDVRAAGQSVRISGNVGDDVIAFGETVTIDANAVISGDVRIFANRAYVFGTIDGTLTVKGDEITFNGMARNGADLRGSDVSVNGKIFGLSTLVAEQFTLEKDASFDGNVQYWIDDIGAEDDLRMQQLLKHGEDFSRHMTSGEAVFDDKLAPFFERGGIKEGIAATGLLALAGITVFSLFSSMLFILLMVLFTKRLFRDAAQHLEKHPGTCFLWGFLYLVVTPIVAVLFMITVIGIPIGMFLLLLYGFSLVFAKPVSAVVLAQWIDHRSSMRWGSIALYCASVGIYIVIKFVALVPILGWFAWLIVFLFCFGALKAAEWKKLLAIR